MVLSNDYIKDQIVLIEGVGVQTILRICDSHLEARRKLESIQVLCAEGVEFLTRTELAEAVLKEIDAT